MQHHRAEQDHTTGCKGFILLDATPQGWPEPQHRMQRFYFIRCNITGLNRTTPQDAKVLLYKMQHHRAGQNHTTGCKGFIIRCSTTGLNRTTPQDAKALL